MADWRAEARKAARRYGLDPAIFERQIGAESGFKPNARSGAGALGIAQITPATAKAWGVNPLDPRAALDAAAKNMAGYVRRYGGYENALRAYNAGPGAIERSHGYAETNRYVSQILHGRDPGTVGTPSRSAPPRPVSSSPGTPASLSTEQGGDPLAGLAGLLSSPTPATPAPVALAAPADSAAKYLRMAGQTLDPTVPVQQPAEPSAASLADLLGPETTVTPGTPTHGTAPAPNGSPSPSPASGMVRFSPGARTGVQSPLVDFLSRVSGTTRQPLVVTTGKAGHRRNVAGTNRVSEHTYGLAADLGSVANGFPVNGSGGTNIAAHAIRTADPSLSWAQARRIADQGGIHNIQTPDGRVQVIWRAPDGSHRDHVHIGFRPK